jgi:hypothetical protein
MIRTTVVAFAAAALCAGCRLYLWAGSHELAIPPAAESTPTPSVTPTLQVTPGEAY